MNYISKVFSPRVNLTRIDEEEIADTIPPTNFENSNMDQSELNQAFTRSQGSTGVDLNNVGDPPSGIRNKKKTEYRRFEIFNSELCYLHSQWEKH